MNVVLVTQNDVFYLPENIEYLHNNLPSPSKIVAAVVLETSPFGKRESFFRKSFKTFRVFGLIFFLRYSFKFLINKLGNKDVIAALKRYEIPILRIAGNINSDKSLEKIRAFNPDVIVSIAANQIFRERLIGLAPKGLLNLHTALLPKYRGLMPSFWVLKNNEKFTGVSVFFVDKGIDSGPILVQKKIPINGMSQEQLIVATKRLGMDTVIEALELLRSGTYTCAENDNSEATYYSFPTRSDVKQFRKIGKQFY